MWSGEPKRALKGRCVKVAERMLSEPKVKANVVKQLVESLR
jgi:hypothetical protein